MPLFALPFPAIDPVLVEVGPFAVRWYALAYIAGILFAWWYMRRLVSTPRLWGPVPRPTPTDIDDFVLWATIGIVAGGRIGFVLFYNFDYYLAHPAEALALWQGGMSFHGGFIGVVIAMILFARSRGIAIWTLFDLAGAATPIGLFFGRIANFINGELWGRPSDVPWAMVFPGAGPEPRHPSQLYEAALEGLVLFLVLRVLTHAFGTLRRPGLTAGAFAAGYGIARIISEFFRMPDPQLGFLMGGLTMGMLLSVPMVLAGAWAIWRARRRPVPEEPGSKSR
ncbi:prolipoprotein diacylglyceryl transferase [Amorphus orientalis]|uniref:Phosphatidylglycerol--prolipoprotein diacylglyceryl transferase n=1 Tax=Amorphus orientalis TaxID=649198 RepID=A0AAE3VLM4_9HYPH|nr:prolipoprotein diacylglyceryl transferase [Amorphus orientalis]MDQ0314228.1 phosphatidylglycerol:prolipoprotein diacylglycerol transferase [Amorphus orientalis]